MKIVYLVLFVLALSISAEAQKAHAVPRKIAMKVVKSFYSSEKVGRRIIGDVYQFTIQTFDQKIKMDSVWFGFTPVPCDVYEIKTLHKVDTMQANTQYLVKANKNLYQYFNDKIDSTASYQLFKPPFQFTKDAVLFSWIHGKRSYQQVQHVVKKKIKSLR